MQTGVVFLPFSIKSLRFFQLFPRWAMKNSWLFRLVWLQISEQKRENEIVFAVRACWEERREKLQINFILFYRRQMTSIEFFTAFCLYEMSARKIRASSSDAQLSHVFFHLVHISNVWWTRWNSQHVSARITSHISRWEKRNYNSLGDHDSHTMPPQHENSFPHRVYF